jgi:hypothetical protein
VATFDRHLGVDKGLTIRLDHTHENDGILGKPSRGERRHECERRERLAHESPHA